MELHQLERLIGEMTLEEKIGMIHGQGIFHTKGVERLGIPPLWMSDGPMGDVSYTHLDVYKRQPVRSAGIL